MHLLWCLYNYLPDDMGTGSSSSGGINLDVLMECYFHQVVQDIGPPYSTLEILDDNRTT